MLDVPQLEITLNGTSVRSTARTLAALLVERGFVADAKVATAVNGGFVSRHDRTATVLKGGDRVEIVAPRQGG